MGQLPNDVYVFDRYQLQPSRRLLTREGVRVPLSPKAFDILLCLIQNAGHVVTKEELLETVWPGTFVSENSLTQHIFQLRKALLDRACLVLTVPSRGYEFTAAVHMRAEGPAVQVAGPDVAEPDVAGADEASSDEAGPDTSTAPPLAMPPAAGKTRVLAWAGVIVLLALGGVLWSSERRLPLVVTETKRLTGDGYVKDVPHGPMPLVSDATFLYFTEMRDGVTVLAKVPLAGGDVTTMPAPFPGAMVVDYSAAQHALLIGADWRTRDDTPILLERPVGAAPVPLAELTGHDASFSPDGSRIAFARGRSLYVANSDGSNSRPIAGFTGILYQPRWSPDGSVLRFSRSLHSMKKQLWEVRPDGGDLHQMFVERNDKDEVCCGAWTRDGRDYVYLSGSAPADSLWMAPAHGRWPFTPKPVRLNLGVADMWRSPLPSADGRKLWLVGEHLHGDLVRVDPATRKVVPYLGGLSAEGLSVSPDGRWMAYTAYPDGTLWISHLDGSGKRQLTEAPLLSRFPRWSPDGKSLVFLAGRANTLWRLYLVSLKTGAARPLVPDEDANEGAATWSPDGRRIAFGKLLNYGTERDPDLSIDIVDIEHASRTTLHGSVGLWTPRWSPDGRYIAAVTEDNQTLKLFDMQTNQWTDVAHLAVNDIAWTPDSHSFYFDSTLGARPLLYRVSVPSGKPEPWADLSGVPRGGFFSPWLGTDPAGDPIFLRDKSMREIYQLSLGNAP